MASHFYVVIPHYFPQKELRIQVSNLPCKSSNPWLLMGDLNEISDIDERQSQYKGSSARHENLKFISDNNLIDLGFQGNLRGITIGNEVELFSLV